MKYILINDIYSFIKKYYKEIIGYYIIILIYYMFAIIYKRPIDLNVVMTSTGVIYKSYFMLDILIFIINLGFDIFIIFQLFNNDINNGYCNIFSRMKSNKWFYCKLFSILIINLFKSLLLYLIISMFLVINNINNFIIIEYFMMTVIFRSFINLCFYAIYIIGNKFRYLIIAFIFILILSNFIPINAYSLQKYYIYYIISTILILISLNFINIKKIKLFDNF